MHKSCINLNSMNSINLYSNIQILISYIRQSILVLLLCWGWSSGSGHSIIIIERVWRYVGYNVQIKTIILIQSRTVIDDQREIYIYIYIYCIYINCTQYSSFSLTHSLSLSNIAFNAILWTLIKKKLNILNYIYILTGSR